MLAYGLKEPRIRFRCDVHVDATGQIYDGSPTAMRSVASITVATFFIMLNLSVRRAVSTEVTFRLSQKHVN